MIVVKTIFIQTNSLDSIQHLEIRNWNTFILSKYTLSFIRMKLITILSSDSKLIHKECQRSWTIREQWKRELRHSSRITISPYVDCHSNVHITFPRIQWISSADNILAVPLALQSCNLAHGTRSVNFIVWEFHCNRPNLRTWPNLPKMVLKKRTGNGFLHCASSLNTVQWTAQSALNAFDSPNIARGSARISADHRRCWRRN